MRKFDPKDPVEGPNLTFDFTKDLLPGETLKGPPTVLISVSVGVDPNPAALLNGAAQVVGNAVVQPVTGGLLGVSYALTAWCATSLRGPLAQGGVIPIVSAPFM